MIGDQHCEVIFGRVFSLQDTDCIDWCELLHYLPIGLCLHGYLIEEVSWMPIV